MKTLQGSGIPTNIIDNKEVSTNATVQTTCMHKTKDTSCLREEWSDELQNLSNYLDLNTCLLKECPSQNTQYVCTRGLSLDFILF